MTRVGVILSGCGFMDGAEIHESVCTLLALDQAGVTTSIYAPDVDFDVVDHLTGAPTGEKRNCLVESARIARGKVEDIKLADAKQLDALFLPGGQGAAKVLSTFADEGAQCSINEDTSRLLREMHAAKKPIAAICIAPAVVARALGEHGPKLTIGTDTGTARLLEGMGCKHESCTVTEFTVDREHKLVTTPAYMLGPSIAHVQKGIEKTVKETLAMI